MTQWRSSWRKCHGELLSLSPSTENNTLIQNSERRKKEKNNRFQTACQRTQFHMPSTYFHQTNHKIKNPICVCMSICHPSAHKSGNCTYECSEKIKDQCYIFGLSCAGYPSALINKVKGVHLITSDQTYCAFQCTHTLFHVPLFFKSPLLCRGWLNSVTLIWND